MIKNKAALKFKNFTAHPRFFGFAQSSREQVRLFATHVLPKLFVSKDQASSQNRAKWVKILKAEILKTETLRVRIARQVVT